MQNKEQNQKQNKTKKNTLKLNVSLPFSKIFLHPFYKMNYGLGLSFSPLSLAVFPKPEKTQRQLSQILPAK